MKNIIGSQVKKARSLHSPKITQADLAARLQVLGWNIDRSGVAKIETGIRAVTDIEVKKLSQALDVSVAWLFEENE